MNSRLLTRVENRLKTISETLSTEAFFEDSNVTPKLYDASQMIDRAIRFLVEAKNVKQQILEQKNSL